MHVPYTPCTAKTAAAAASAHLSPVCAPLRPQDDLRGRNLTDSGERPYALSKTYILMALTRELARRLEGTGVDVIGGGNSVQPTT